MVNIYKLKNLKKNFIKIQKFYDDRKYSLNALKMIISEIKTDFIDYLNNVDSNYKQIGGLNTEVFLRSLDDLQKKLAVLGTRDFKELLTNLEEMIDIFEGQVQPMTP